MLTNEPCVSSSSLFEAHTHRTVLQNIGIMCTSWEAEDHIQKLILGFADQLDIYRVVLLVVEIWERIWRWCLNAQVCAEILWNPLLIEICSSAV